MIIVRSPLTKNNYLIWSISMIIALKAKDKLGLINGKCKMPDPNAPSYEECKRIT